MEKTQTTGRNGFSRPLPQPIVLTPAEAKQVAGGDAGPAPYNQPGQVVGGPASSSGDDAKGYPRDE